VAVGRRLERRQVRAGDEHERAALYTIEAAIYGLLGLMVAFSFAGAASRFDTRRSLTVDEANAIGTAYLRVDLLPAAAQPAMRDKFRRYTLERIAVYQALPDVDASDAHAARAMHLQDEIWRDAVAALDTAPPSAALLVLPSLNEMIDITSTRAIYLRTHTPPLVTATLVILSLVCALLVGNGLPREDTGALRLHTYGFALVLSVTLYVIFDLDHPRAGLIRLDYTDQAMQKLLEAMPPPAPASAASG
jgi:hypothetical protein